MMVFGLRFRLSCFMTVMQPAPLLRHLYGEDEKGQGGHTQRYNNAEQKCSTRAISLHPKKIGRQWVGELLTCRFHGCGSAQRGIVGLARQTCEPDLVIQVPGGQVSSASKPNRAEAMIHGGLRAERFELMANGASGEAAGLALLHADHDSRSCRRPGLFCCAARRRSLRAGGAIQRFPRSRRRRCVGADVGCRHTEQNEQCLGQPRTVCTDAHI